MGLDDGYGGTCRVCTVYKEMEVPPNIFDKVSCTLNIELQNCEFIKERK